TYGGFFVPINTLPTSTFAGGLTPGDYLKNISSPGTLTSYWQVNTGAVERVLFAELEQSGRVLYPQQSFSAQEKTTGGFVMGNFEGDHWRGNPGALTGAAGNPDLDPYRATQEDLAVEWYPDRDTAFTLALYNKDIKSFIVDVPVAGNFPIQSATQPNAACTPTGTPNLFNCPFTINKRANGGGGKARGAELGFTKPIWGGFGLQANYTYSDSKLDSGDPVPGDSKNTYNVTGFFENKRLSARLAYTYRSDFFVTFDRSTHLDQSALKSLDASVALNITDNIALT